MKRFLILFKVLVCFLAFGPLAYFAHGEETLERPTIIIAPKVSVKAAKIRLGDIAVISYKHQEFEDVAHRLADVIVGDIPVPMSTSTLIGANILSAIESIGVSRETIGYSIPKSVEVERLGREVPRDEMVTALRERFSKDDLLDVQVKDIVLTSSQVIPIGETTYDFARLGEPAGGKVPIRVEVVVDGESAARFLATALVDDWREVPVLNRALDRGMLVRAEDVQMVRLNLFKQPEDVISQLDEVVGKRVKSRLTAGDTVRRADVDIPPVIPKGSRVVMLYERGGLSASALGQAIEDGFDGGKIAVKNIKSQKVLNARVKNKEQVEVIAE